MSGERPFARIFASVGFLFLAGRGSGSVQSLRGVYRAEKGIRESGLPSTGCALARWAVLLSILSLGSLACDDSTSKSATPKMAQPPSPVSVETIKQEPFFEKRSFFGQVRAVSDANLGAAESGRVKVVHVVEGAMVKKGQVLVELDDQLARVQLNEAIASRDQTDSRSEQAKFELERYGKLREEKVVSELEASRKVSEAQTLKAVAEGDAARVAREAEMLRRHRIIAPFDGTITERRVDAGDWLGAGQMALQIVTSGHVEVEVRAPASVLDALQSIKEVAIVYGKRRVPARVDSAVDALDPETRTALLRVTPLEEAPGLRVGAGVYVDISVSVAEGLNLPRDAVVYGVAQPRVFLMEEGKAESVNIEILAASADRVLAKGEGLQVGQRIIVRGNERLRPGQAVTEKGALLPKGVRPEEKKP